MRFVDRREEMGRLDRALARPGSFSVIWGRRRVGKSRLLVEWSGRHNGLYTVADLSVPSVQRRYLASAVAERFPNFADVEYPNWRAFLTRLSEEADRVGWPGPFVIDELPYLIAADPGLASDIQNWIDHPSRQLGVVVSGSSQRMMHGAVLDASAPLYGRADQAFALRPLQPGHLSDAFGSDDWRWLVSLYALWGGMPRYWELALPFGSDLEAAVDSLVLDPAGPLHEEPARLLEQEIPPASALRPLLDVIGAGAHRVSEVGGRLGRAASSLSRPLKSLVEMGLVRRETPFGANPRTSKRSLYRIDDPFLRLWFRVIAPHRAAMYASPPESRLLYWKRHRGQLEGYAWQELCRAAVPLLHRADHPVAKLGPFEPAWRYWRGSQREVDLVTPDIERNRLLVGEAKLSASAADVSRWTTAVDNLSLPASTGMERVPVMFVATAGRLSTRVAKGYVVDARTVFTVLRQPRNLVQ
ncbi:MAG: ATP-binding protein [Bryobacterales bacterium]|nr:ATP-binding protein [Bryobacterales bacterium]